MYFKWFDILRLIKKGPTLKMMLGLFINQVVLAAAASESKSSYNNIRSTLLPPTRRGPAMHCTDLILSVCVCICMWNVRLSQSDGGGGSENVQNWHDKKPVAGPNKKWGGGDVEHISIATFEIRYHFLHIQTRRMILINI